MYGVSLILAPLLLAISSFFWINGEYSVMGEAILALSMVFCMPAQLFLFSLLKDRIPNYANWGYWSPCLALQAGQILLSSG